MRNFLKGILCRVFHRIKTIDKSYFVDKVSGECIGRYECLKCGKEYLSNSKRDSYRCYINK